MLIWYILWSFGMLYQENLANPATHNWRLTSLSVPHWSKNGRRNFFQNGGSKKSVFFYFSFSVVKKLLGIQKQAMKFITSVTYLKKTTRKKTFFFSICLNYWATHFHSGFLSNEFSKGTSKTTKARSFLEEKIYFVTF
jgi:hypothetical protein